MIVNNAPMNEALNSSFIETKTCFSMCVFLTLRTDNTTCDVDNTDRAHNQCAEGCPMRQNVKIDNTGACYCYYVELES